MRRRREAVLTVLLTVLLASCRRADQEWVLMLPEGKADLVAVLKPGLNYKEVARFQAETLILGADEKRQRHRPGLRGIMGTEVDGHVAFALTLDRSATASERALLRKGIESSPYLLRLFENVAPDSIRLDSVGETGKARGT